MSVQPLVSVIVPCYNYGRFLSEALDSLLAQAYSNWECIVVDDGSTDNTGEVAQRYAVADGRFIYVHQKNLGLAGARNTALQRAKGAYIQLLDADDLLEHNKLFLQIPLLETNKNIDLVFSNILSFRHSDPQRKFKPLKMEAPSVSGKGEVLISNLMTDNFFLPGCVLFRKELYDQVGLFRTGMSGMEDWNYWFRAALSGAEFYNDTREGTHLLARNHGENMSSFRKNMLQSRINARRDIMSFTTELQQQGRLTLPSSFLDKIKRLHIAFLNRDEARLNLMYGNVVKGSLNTLKHAYYSQKPYFAFYDGAYWLKERLKRSLQAEKK